MVMLGTHAIQAPTDQVDFQQKMEEPGEHIKPAECNTCKTITQGFTTNSQRKRNQDSFVHIIDLKCLKCAPLVSSFRDFCRSRGKESKDLAIRSIGSGIACLQVWDGDYEPGMDWDLRLVKRGQGHPGTGRILDRDWAYIDMIKQWRRDCSILHGEKCNKPMKIWPARPA